jgi:hypothetical protein
MKILEDTPNRLKFKLYSHRTDFLSLLFNFSVRLFLFGIVWSVVLSHESIIVQWAHGWSKFLGYALLAGSFYFGLGQPEIMFTFDKLLGKLIVVVRVLGFKTSATEHQLRTIICIRNDTGSWWSTSNKRMHQYYRFWIMFCDNSSILVEDIKTDESNTKLPQLAQRIRVFLSQ